MPLQQVFFYIPAKEPEEAQEKMNNFLKTVVVDNIQREFVFDGNSSYWCVAVEYMTESKRKSSKKSDSDKEWIDYKDVLPPDAFSLYLKLKKWRNDEADRKGCAAYHIFKNEHLAAIAKDKIVSKSKMSEIKGVSEKRLEKYANAAIDIVKEDLALRERIYGDAKEGGDASEADGQEAGEYGKDGVEAPPEKSSEKPDEQTGDETGDVSEKKAPPCEQKKFEEFGE